MTLDMKIRRQVPMRNHQGYFVWQREDESVRVTPRGTALVICDMWDRNWSRAANERVVPLSYRIAELADALRSVGATIVHAPSDTMAYYEGHPARKRALSTTQHDLPPGRELPDPPLPIDDSDGGSDTNDGSEPVHKQTWTCQIDTIRIDDDRDYISDSGAEIYSIFKERCLRWILLCGVHTNMCILDRSFGIKNMVSRGVPMVLLRDLTDSMYNPARPPYVDHDRGTELVIGYIEKFWCSTTEASELLGALRS